jgi:hypothetical protein
LAPHIAATVERAAGQTALVSHDTTEFRFRDREGMGRLSRDENDGFLCHVSLALEPGELRTPLGVLALKTWARTAPARKKKTKSKKTNHIPASERESRRWWEQVEAAEEQVANRGCSLIHLMDSEADAYPLFCQLVAAKRRFVIRLHVNRRVLDGGAKGLDEKLAMAPTRIKREVPLSARGNIRGTTGKGRHALRAARVAELEISASIVTLRAPAGTESAFPKTVTLTVIRVFEPNPPPGAEPVEWKLATTEPIRTKADVEAIVDAYRARWVVEEYFKALKTGCAFETRQLESYATITKALAIFTPIAYEMLRLRTMARQEDPRPARKVFRPSLWLVLRKHPQLRLHEDSTVRDAFLAIAQLGGHIKNNGAPGWRVLGRGYEKVLAIEIGVLIARQNYDQS